MLILRRVFLVSVALLIAVLSHQPSLKPPFELFPHQDKVFHFLQFAGLGLALHLNRDMWPRRPLLYSFLSGTLWAVLDEIHQHFVPGRHCDILDIAADVAGLLTALAALDYLSNRGKNRKGTRTKLKQTLDS